MANWTAEEAYELITTWVKYHKFGHLNINFKGGEIPNIEIYESKKPPRKAGIVEETNGNTER